MREKYSNKNKYQKERREKKNIYKRRLHCRFIFYKTVIIHSLKLSRLMITNLSRSKEMYIGD